MALFNKQNNDKKEETKKSTTEDVVSQVESMNLSELNKEDQDKSKKSNNNIKPFHYILLVFIFLFISYIFLRMGLIIYQSGSPYKVEVSKGLGLYPYMFQHAFIMTLFIILLSLGISYFIIHKMTAPKEHDEDRLKFAKIGVVGTTCWMSNKEINERFNLCPVDDLDGIPIGVRYGKAICIPWEPKSLDTTLPNDNIFINGPAGTRKSRGLIIPHCMQYLRHGTSLVVTDTKGDLYRKLAPIAEHYGYNIKKFICQSERFKYSDGWDCLKSIKESADPIGAANMFASVVIRNTEDPHSNNPKFWRDQDENLLSALVMYVATSPSWVPLVNRKVAKRDIKEVYALLSTDLETVEQIFENIKVMNPKDFCIGPYDRWHSNKQYEQSFSNLATRLRILQNDYISGMLSADDIDIKSAGKEKTIFFIIMDDQDSTYQFISSLFFSFTFYELVKSADEADQVLDIPVQFMLDEFPNCGIIPDFTRKISTVRSRGIGITICIQGLNQLKLLYPDGEWENILNNCAVRIILGSYENTTAKYFSDQIGDCTVVVENQAMDFATFSLARLLGIAKFVKITKQNVQRKLLKPEEIIGMEINRQIVLVAGTTHVLEEHKYDLSMHPDSKITANIKHTEGTPQWIIDDGLTDYVPGGVNPSENIDMSTGEIIEPKLSSEKPTGISSIVSHAKEIRQEEKELESFKLGGLSDFDNEIPSEDNNNVNDTINDNYLFDELTDDFFEEFDDDSGLL